MLSIEKAVYWTISGSLLGIGFIGFGLGGLPILLGGVLALYGVSRFGPHGFWITVVAMGAVPALILLYQYFTARRSNITVGPNQLAGVSVFGILALSGVVWGLIEARRGGAAPPGPQG